MDDAIRLDGRPLMSPELHLLIACIAGQTAPAVDVDWDRFARLAVSHGVATLASRALRNISETLPPHILAGFVQLRRSSALLGAVGLRQRDEVVHTLYQEDIQCLVLKGAALAQAWYVDLSLRPFIDIDVLVAAGDIKRARQALLQAGYRDTSGTPTSYHEVPLQHPDRLFTVELHHRLTCLPLQQRFCFEQLYARSIQVSRDGPEVRTLSPEDTLLHLCLHLLNHLQMTQGWKLSYLYDIAHHIAAFPIDWEIFTARTDRHGADRGCGAVLGAASLIAGASVPPNQIDSVATLELLRYPTTDRYNVSHHFLAAFLAALSRGEGRQAGAMLLRAMVSHDCEARRPAPRDLRPHLLLWRIGGLLHELVSAPQQLHRQVKAWLPEGETLVGRERLVADLFSSGDS